MGQEPGTEEEVQACVRGELKATFPVFAKTDVNGSDVDEVFRFVKTALPGFLGTTSVKWNFTKFLIRKDGMGFRRYSPQTSPASLEDDIEQLLAEDYSPSPLMSSKASDAAAATGMAALSGGSPVDDLHL